MNLVEAEIVEDENRNDNRPRRRPKNVPECARANERTADHYAWSQPR